MQLTTLEIKGFKSFAERTTLRFNNRITGIAGPNGCGKSNVVDSIRWVLGEQKTSQLRLEKMDNLIFSGTKQRQAAGLAEVSLTFENTKNLISSDYKTITVTRRLFRGGESEYLLNGLPCRLKDILTLFLDTGIGSDSYAIIELGMIDEILNDQDNSRRALFEQAAGVQKYKKRKKETVDKLKSSDNDLNRIKDLLFEIEAQLKTLEAQAKKAKRYYELKEEHKELSLLLSKYELQSYKETYKNIEGRKQIVEERKIEIETLIKQTIAALEKEKVETGEKENALFASQKKLQLIVAQASEKESARNLLNQKIKNALDKKDTAEKQINEADSQVLKLKASIEVLSNDKQTQEKALENKKEELNSIESQLSEIRNQHAGVKETFTSQQKVYAEREKRILELDKQLAVIQNSSKELQQDLSRSDQDVVRKRTELQGLQSEFDNQVEAQKSAGEKLQSLIEAEELRTNQIAELSGVIEKLKAELTKEMRTLDAKKNEFDLTKSMIENLEGFPESIKFLKKNEAWNCNAPLLSDIIYCPEDYRIAIEAYLENHLNYYIVQHIEEAAMAIKLLSDSAIGRANFFILDELEKYEPLQALEIPNANTASNLVEIDNRYKKLKAYLFDRVYIVDDSSGFDIPTDLQGNSVVILTKNGRYIRRDFSLGGGAVGLFEGKRMGRVKNLEKLQEEIKALEISSYKSHQQVVNTQVKIDRLKSDSAAHEIDELRALANSMISKISGMQATITSLASFLEGADVKSKTIAEKLNTTNTETDRIYRELHALREIQTADEAILKKADGDFIEATNRLSEISSRYNQKNIEFHQQQNRTNSVAQELAFKQSQIESFNAQLERNKEVIGQSQLETEEWQNAVKEIEVELLSIYADKESYKSDAEETEKAYYDSKGVTNQLDAKARELARNKDAIAEELAGINEKFNELRLSVTAMKEKLHVEFNIDINTLLEEEFEMVQPIEEVRAGTEKIKSRMENFGEINPMAIEAFEELKKRHDFIIAQRKELEDAKGSLLATIQEIEHTAKDMFLESFNKIRENFVTVFRTLFSEEDQCNLVLENPDEPLESKIQIIAKPKGKRPTAIDQLSQGEKTLTAIALLFSLYLLKPAPFCIFDEVDAPLDDVNIYKLNKIIQEFSKDSQFIIVTHNKSAMSVADAIYGVTMQEQGVSLLVPVDFSNMN